MYSGNGKVMKKGKAMPDPPGGNAKQDPSKARRKDGLPCQGKTLPNEPYCLVHHPEKTAMVAASRSAGGRARWAKKSMPLIDENNLPSWWQLGTIRDTGDMLAHLARECLKGSIEPRQANAVAVVAGYLMKARSTDIEERLALVEEALGLAKPGSADIRAAGRP